MTQEVIALRDGILARDRRVIARALSFIESSRDDQAEERDELLKELLQHCVSARRIGVTGAPGVGKSSLIEKFGLKLIEQGHRVAVIAVDPTSSRSGGSILGDKLRMQELSRAENAFIRPSPSGTGGGGVSERTRESIVVLEAAGFDTILIETVGVGQTEYAISSMVDLFVLLLLPNSGDDVQAVKRGIMEVADIIAVTKADVSPTLNAAALSSLHTVSSLLRPRIASWTTRVHSVSASNSQGLTELIKSCDEFFDSCVAEIEANRKQQLLGWFESCLHEGLLRSVLAEPRLQQLYQHLVQQVRNAEALPSAAAREFFAQSRKML